MVASSKLSNAVSAIALSAGLTVAGAGVAVTYSTTQAEAAVVRSILVRGNSRIDDSTVRGNITISPGQPFDNGDIDDSVKRLFSTGLFSDVRISVSGSSLVVQVDENLIVNQVIFNGNRKLKDAQLSGVTQTSPLGPYNPGIVDADLEAIKEAYRAIGRDDATITTQVVEVGEGRVNIAFEINEGDRTKIRSINFVGNQAFGDGRLADVIKTKRSSFLSFLSRKDVYDSDKLRADEELLRRFYYNHGFADFRVISSVADLDPTRNEYVITVTVDEGERYTFGEVYVESTVDGLDGAELQRLVSTRTGKAYSAEEVEESIIAISDRVSSAGYPFAQVTPRGDRDFANRTISVVYLVDQGPRAYIERIEIRGNTRTRDYVIRREFDISEGDAFNQVMIRRAKKRLENLGFFEAVNISTAPGSEPDRVVVVVDVRDQSTGEFSIGGGYSSGNGATVEAAIQERNFLGRGQFIRIAAGGGEDKTSYNFSFTEPYLLGYRLAAGFSIYQTEDSSLSQYDYTETGFSLSLTAPITEKLSAGIAYNFVQTDYGVTATGLSTPYASALGMTNNSLGSRVLPDGSIVQGTTISPSGSDPWINSSVALTLTYDNLDDRKNPREGYFARGAATFAGVGGDANFAAFTGSVSYFHPISEAGDIIGQVRLGGGHMFATSGSVRALDQFFIGGETVRGFDARGIGPRVLSPAVGSAGNPPSNLQTSNATGNTKVAGTPVNYNDPLGGTTYFNASVEATFPMPLLSKELGIRGAFFADAGTLYGSDIAASDIDTANGETVIGTNMTFRASVGASLIWASPFGPLRFDYAIPLKKESFDEIRNFRFGASTRF